MGDLRVMRRWQKVRLKIHRVARICQPPHKSTEKPTNAVDLKQLILVVFLPFFVVIPAAQQALLMLYLFLKAAFS